MLLVAVAAFFGARLFLVAVLLLAAVALLEMSAALAATAARPVVAAAAVAALGTPLRAGLQPDGGIAVLPPLVVIMLLLAFVLMIVAGRRASATVALGATALCGLLVGLGAGALILLQALDGGWRWVVGLVALVAVGEAVARLRDAPSLRGTRSWRAMVAVLTGAPAMLLVGTALSS